MPVGGAAPRIFARAAKTLAPPLGNTLHKTRTILKYSSITARQTDSIRYRPTECMSVVRTQCSLTDLPEQRTSPHSIQYIIVYIA